MARRLAAAEIAATTSVNALELELAMSAADRLCADAVAIAEAYSPERFKQRAGAFGLQAGVALDLRTGWDLSLPKQQEAAREALKRESPYLLVLSPLCVAFSTLQNLNKNSARYESLLATGRMHLEYACSLAGDQLDRGGRILFEHPWGASSWLEPRLKALLARPGCRRVRCDQCLFGQRTVDMSGQVMPAQKATGFLTNDEYLAKALDRRCPGHHDHGALMGGRAKATERYPPRLVAAILKALRESMRAAGCKPKDGLVGTVNWSISAVETGPVLEEPEALERPPASAAEAEFLDQATGLPLDPEKVRVARAEEWAYMEELEVMKEASLDEALAETGLQPIPTR